MAKACITKNILLFVLILNTRLAYAEDSPGQNNQSEVDCESQSDDEQCQQDTHQTLIITSRKSPFAGLKPTTQATSILEISKHVKVPATLTELVEGIPGVAENSQPGLYQVISIRGVSRQRILSLVDGVRINGERRAGVATSFIDPLLLGHVQVTRGPVSTYYGSGAIGGVTQLFFRKEEGLDAAVGYKNLGNEQYQMFHWGDQSTNAAIVRRQANNSEDINSNPLNTHFEQTAGYLQKSWQLENGQLDSWLFSSTGNDIGRSNSRYPNRIVNVPDETHHLLKTSFTSPHKWSLDFFLHQQSITTNTLRPLDSLSNVTSDSLDIGANWQTAWEQPDQSILLGIDWYGRRNVNTKEQTTDLQNDQLTNSHTLKNGHLDEFALFYTFHKRINDYRIQLGGRYTFESVGQQDSANESNTALTGFAGIAFELSERLELSANIGNAFRLASLTERFFSGTTARGTVQGNSELNSEKAMTYDLGFNWHIDNKKLKATFFLTEFDDYIERIEVAENRLTFVNFEDGQIKGIEAEFDWMLSERLDINLIATFIQGENSLNQALSDIPSDRVSLSFSYHTNDWVANLRLQHRTSKNDPGNGELATNSANILAANFSYKLNSEWQLRVYADNLLDDTYVSSADDLATLAAGRNFGFMLNWRKD